MQNLRFFWFSILSLMIFSLYTENAPTRIPTAIMRNLEQSAELWAATYSILSPTSLELLANFLYLSYRHAYLDEQAGKALVELKTTLPQLRTQLRSSNNPMPTTGTYLRASKRFFAFNGLRYHMYLCWQQCAQHLESTDDTALRSAYEQLQLNGQHTIADYLSSNATIYISLTQIQQHIKQATERLTEIKCAIEALFEKMVTNTQIEDNVIDTDHAFQVSKQIQKITEHLYIPVAAVDQHQNNLLYAGTQLFRTHYCALYNHVPAGNRRMLFGPYGIVTEQYQHQLPSPDCC